MPIYRKGQSQFGLHKSAQLQKQQRLDNSKLSKKIISDTIKYAISDGEPTPEIIENMTNAIDHYEEGMNRQEVQDAVESDVDITDWLTKYDKVHEAAKSVGINTEFSTPISGDDIARGLAGKKALDQLKNL